MQDFQFANATSKEVFGPAFEFEQFVKEVFESKGFTVGDVSGVGERGADFLAMKGETRLVVQVKCGTRRIRKSVIRRTKQAQLTYGVDEAVVVTNGLFTPHARKLARLERVTLYDGERLLGILDHAQAVRFRQIEGRARSVAGLIAQLP